MDWPEPQPTYREKIQKMTQQTFKCSNSTTKTPEKGVKSVQS